jgi:HAD superfamily hydrolase (TIGR01509 family)
MASLFTEPEFLQVFTPPATDEGRKELIAAWHKRKTAIQQEIVNSGRIPPRSGVKRLAEEALAAGWLLAVASTSAQASVEAMLRRAMGEETAARFSLVLAGDVVKAKKPAPDIYLLAAERLGVRSADCVVIEDSNNGVVSAVAAGMKCVVTVSGYTREEDFSQAAIVLTCLGDPGGEVCEVLANRSAARPGAWFTAKDLEAVLAS